MEVLLLPWSSSSKILVSNFSLSAFRGPLPSVPAFLLLSELFLHLPLPLESWTLFLHGGRKVLGRGVRPWVC